LFRAAASAARVTAAYRRDLPQDRDSLLSRIHRSLPLPGLNQLRAQHAEARGQPGPVRRVRRRQAAPDRHHLLGRGQRIACPPSGDEAVTEITGRGGQIRLVTYVVTGQDPVAGNGLAGQP
jgi:hypothetical protein